MGAYDHKQILADYAHGRITAEMATGHILQHLGQLYDAQSQAGRSRHELRETLTDLTTEIKAIRQAVGQLAEGRTVLDRVRLLENQLAALDLTVYELKEAVEK